MLKFIFPGNCVLCGAACENSYDLCTKCIKDLPRHAHACERCGELLVANQKICGSCLKNPPPFASTFALFHYQKPVDHLITSLKFGHNLIYAKILGELLTQFLQQKYFEKSKPEIIIPVPLHKNRLCERGFNQALEIARPISKHLNIPINQFYCERIKNTEAQSELSFNERGKNIKNAFAITQSKKYKHIAIIDDVMTTGNTVTELSKILRATGVEKIDIWCCART